MSNSGSYLDMFKEQIIIKAKKGWHYNKIAEGYDVIAETVRVWMNKNGIKWGKTK